MNRNKISASQLMPKSDSDRRVLGQRAKQLAEPYENKKLEQEDIFLHFKLNQNMAYGIPQNMIDEVFDAEYLTLLPWLPPFILGVVNWKGSALTVLDTNYLCSGEAIDMLENFAVIVIDNGENKLGLAVNEIANFVSYPHSAIKKQMQSPISFNKDYFLGLFNDSVILLNINMIMTDQALIIK